MPSPIRCHLLGHKPAIVPTATRRIEWESMTIGYDVTYACRREGCGYVDPLTYFYGVDTPDALYLEATDA